MKDELVPWKVISAVEADMCRRRHPSAVKDEYVPLKAICAVEGG